MIFDTEGGKVVSPCVNLTTFPVEGRSNGLAARQCAQIINNMAPSLTPCVLLLVFGGFAAFTHASRRSLPKDMHQGNVFDQTNASLTNILYELGVF